MDSAGEKNLANQPEKHFHKYLGFAEFLITAYKGTEPFHHFIRNYFSSHKKHGSKDRKYISSFCYNYFRLGHGVRSALPLREKILFGTFLCETGLSPAIVKFTAGWDQQIHLDQEKKLSLLETDFDPKNIFPFPLEVSEKIELRKFNLSFLKQPRVFIRVRPGKESVVLKQLHDANLSFEKMNGNSLVFSANENVSRVLQVDKDVVVQDYNSQRVGEMMATTISNGYSSKTVWDCCAGSGGKSILAFDVLKNPKLTVTDKRASIIRNLRERFASAGIKNFQAFVHDLASESPLPFKNDFNLVIADVPCSGSGTWSRTPEQLCYFQQKDIAQYASLQKKIIQKILPRLQAAGILLYITCSVFKKENEENVDYILDRFPVTLLRMEYLEGYQIEADTLFVAVFRKQE